MKTLRQNGGFAKRHSLLAQAVAIAVSAVLAAFHGVLLWQRVLDQSLFKPVPAVRWLATILLLVGLYRLHRRGVSLMRGRGALIFWLLVLLLHVSFWGPLAKPESTFAGWTGTGLLLALPAISITLGIVCSRSRRLLARLLRRARQHDLPFFATVTAPRVRLPRAGNLPALACRPPPLV